MSVVGRRWWLVCILVSAVSGCTQLTAGKSYLLSKVDDGGYLRDASMVFADPAAPRSGGWDSPVANTLELRLADNFIKYIHSFDLPEVVLFSRVVIRDPSSASRGVVYERVIMNTEDANAFTTANQGAGSAMRDLTILPAIQYTGQEITVSIRLIELDQNDNKRYAALLSGAAAAVTSFRPEVAMSASVAQAALTFILANNPDDLEFTYDFGISPNSQTTVERVKAQIEETALPETVPQKHDLVLQPRIGTLAVLKTELPDRMVIPVERVSIVTDGIRWILMSVLRLATLNAFNMFNEDKGYDRYARWFGQPLYATFQALDEPVLDQQGYVYHIDYHPLTSVFGRVDNCAENDRTSQPGDRRNQPLAGLGNGTPKRLRIVNGSLVYEDRCSEVGLEPFRGKSYLVLTIDNPQKGVPVDELEKIGDSVAKLGIRTTQLSPEEFQQELDKVTKVLAQAAVMQNAKADGNRQIADAKTLEEAAAAANTALKAACGRLENEGASGAVLERQLHEIRAQLQRDLQRKERELCRVSLLRPADGVFDVTTGNVAVTIEHPIGQKYEGVLLSANGIVALETSEFGGTATLTQHIVKPKSVTDLVTGNYELRLTPKKAPTP
ncbi:MAG: hypothetical protein AB1762_20810, partial [Gemmatimonadota bacterium]